MFKHHIKCVFNPWIANKIDSKSEKGEHDWWKLMVKLSF